MTEDEGDIERIARRFFDAIEQGDIATLASLYADDARIWHAAEDALSTKAQNLERLRVSTTTWPGRRYEDRDLRVFPGGFVQRHLLVREQDGERRTAPACILCDVRDGRITALYEYFDLGQMAEWRR